MKRYRILPDFAVTILTNYPAWLVGSAATYLAEDTDKEPDDFDIIVHPDSWLKVMRHIRDNTLGVEFNTYGGLKVDNNIDVWPDTIEGLAASGRSFTAYKPIPKTIIRVACG